MKSLKGLKSFQVDLMSQTLRVQYDPAFLSVQEVIKSIAETGMKARLEREKVGITIADIKFEIIKKIGVLSKTSKGWAKELNLISWNDRQPKYDIREWSPEHDKMGKGVTLSKEELKALKQVLDKLDLV